MPLQTGQANFGMWVAGSPIIPLSQLCSCKVTFAVSAALLAIMQLAEMAFLNSLLQ